jgi:hypothetical protein
MLAVQPQMVLIPGELVAWLVAVAGTDYADQDVGHLVEGRAAHRNRT